jgi:hypothetical protein
VPSANEHRIDVANFSPIRTERRSTKRGVAPLASFAGKPGSNSQPRRTYDITGEQNERHLQEQQKSSTLTGGLFLLCDKQLSHAAPAVVLELLFQQIDAASADNSVHGGGSVVGAGTRQ